jgi:hypothetical protein
MLPRCHGDGPAHPPASCPSGCTRSFACPAPRHYLTSDTRVPSWAGSTANTAADYASIGIDAAWLVLHGLDAASVRRFGEHLSLSDWVKVLKLVRKKWCFLKLVRKNPVLTCRVGAACRSSRCCGTCGCRKRTLCSSAGI